MNEIIQKYDEQLFKLLSTSFSIDEVIELFWQAINEIYRIALEKARELAAAGDPLEESELRALTYDGSADKTEERIKGHIEAIFFMEDIEDTTSLTLDDKSLLQSLFTLLMRLFENEMKYVYNNIVFHKLLKSSIEWYAKIVTGEMCEHCRDIAGETYSLEELKSIGLPPYHPDCDCTIEWITKEEKELLGY